MIRVRKTLALCCAALLLACGQPPGEGPALWRVSDADSTVYLFGTVHVLPRELQWKSERITKAFADSETIWFETPTDAAAGAKIAAIVAAEGMNPPGVTLSSQLAPADRARLVRVTASLGVAPGALERVRPWVAAVQLSLALLLKQGHDPAAGVEHVLEADAAAQGKRTAYFETPEEQMALFAGLTPEAERRFLSATLRQIEEEAHIGAEMDRLWASGDTGALGRLLAAMTEEAGPEIADALIYRRNERWAARIDDMVDGGAGVAFVAVGAAHMSGPRGLPALLRAQGHRVDGPEIVK